MPRKISESKTQEWLYHFSEQKQSGLSRTEYCRINGLDKDQFYYHHKNLTKTDKQTQTPEDNSDFISVSIAPESHSEPIELNLTHPNTTTLSIKAHWNHSQLLNFISAWRAVI